MVQESRMKRLRECISEGLEDKYGAYKSKVLDTLASVGIVIDPSKMKHAEEWIKDFYDDKMSSFDCASSIRDNFSRLGKITESFEKYATEIVNSAPALQKKRAVKRIKAMDRIQKAQFDHVVLTLCGLKNLDPKEFISAHGYEILKLVQDGYLNVDEIIERIGQQILGKTRGRKMTVEEALEILGMSGKRIDESETDSLGVYLCTKSFTHGNLGQIFKRGREYDATEVHDDGRILVGKFWISPEFLQEHFMKLD